ncbi:hypothetical protein Sjap_017683 [Stephania japonica]|uniref:Uncharacterized protein n=1 Tax=Stephania japonica TaxID=461633 RepID=A0AAP0I6S0_9MAGN
MKSTMRRICARIVIFLDILRLCKRFIDIHIVGFKITYEDGRPLRDDENVMFMMKEHECIKDVGANLDRDETT